MQHPIIASLALSVAQVTDKTWWTFIELTASDGTTGFGEATLTGRERDLEQAARALFPRFLHRPVAEGEPVVALSAVSHLPTAAILSGIDHALWDLRAKHASQSLAQCLGDVRHPEVALYANINRRTSARTPADFAASARAAVAAGFTAIKIAPFDEAALYGKQADPTTERAAIERGLERIAATRAAVGASIDLMVDCHWRLNTCASLALLDELTPYALYWLECPVPEIPEQMDSIRRIRSRANDLGIRLAGCEEAIGVGGFRPFLDAGAYDVMMPDVKYVGGVREVLAVAALLDRYHVEFSPHNPSGPIAHAVSLQLSAIVPNFRRLEMQFDETPVFDALLAQRPPSPHQGRARLSDRPGHGATLDVDTVRLYQTLEYRIAADD
ncbi:mandelate racemase/muconate lactonizing enzyme family protein [Burkholderia sp. TSV86]|uniref:mandelate racemase/muconate lactonizing enzyme family protein n=1 Tax=Burkholderia sp. TSV86 TaxID=1385594 RepID=UPI00075427B3|nr:mandelate racemase/muconate lactonizing enzyme family protein [Burkholderia sp. TSV86]KVE36322.1 hypothetical protein WS68_04785 [Burkholderia sp. TSV86]